MLTGVLFSLFEVLIDFKVWGVANTVYAVGYSVIFINVTLFCQTATNEAEVPKLLLGGNCRNECVEGHNKFSFYLHVMKIEYTACELWLLRIL
jgi:hypothetical protein